MERYTDPETGLIYLRARYYDPNTAQFLTPDPLYAITGERYGYAGNDPINGSDPMGLCGFLGNGPCTPSGVAHDVKHRGDQAARTIRHATGICSTYADPGCKSAVNSATNGRYGSRLFEPGFTEPIGEARIQGCALYGCEAITYDGSFHHHEGLGPAIGLSSSFSPWVTSCGPRDEAFGSYGVVGGSLGRSSPDGHWSPTGSLGYGYNYGFVHWFN